LAFRIFLYPWPGRRVLLAVAAGGFGWCKILYMSAVENFACWVYVIRFKILREISGMGMIVFNWYGAGMVIAGWVTAYGLKTIKGWWWHFVFCCRSRDGGA